jgi:phosphoglycerate dehydrogenase-like enzyme
MPKIHSLLAVLTPREITDFLPDTMLSELRSIAENVQIVDSTFLDAAHFHHLLADKNPDVLVACWKTPPLPPVLPANLKYVCYLTGSVKKLLTRAHLEHGLLLTNWGGSVSRVVAECALLLTLAALRRAGHWIPAMHREGAWKNGHAETASLFGRRVGLHGFGLVARELTKLLVPFDVEISVCAPESDPALYAAHRARPVATLEELFGHNDIVIELAPLIPATTGIITERLLRLIKPGGLFVNVGRGAVVDEEALLRVAREDRIQIALDVYGTEPLPANSGFRGLSNVILLPHLAGPTTDRRRDAGAFGLRNLHAYISDQLLQSKITPDVFDHST